MKVLFAVSNDSISDAVIKRYPKEYRELLSYKNVYYFNAILKEIQNDKSYDRIVISEDLEPFVNSNHDAIDNFIFDHLDKISDEAQGIDGREISIILICSERRTFGTNILNKFFSIGIYNALIGNDRNMSELCKLINKPRTKKEAKIYYRIDNASYDPAGEHGEVSETEIQNILNHFKKLGKATDRYAESFDNIAAQYTDDQLRLIVNVLPMKVKAVLEVDSAKYQALMGTGGASSNPKANTAASKDTGISINSIGKTTNMNGPVVIPSGVKRFTGSGVRAATTSQSVNIPKPVQPKVVQSAPKAEAPKPTSEVVQQAAEPVKAEPVVKETVKVPEPVKPVEPVVEEKPAEVKIPEPVQEVKQPVKEPEVVPTASDPVQENIDDLIPGLEDVPMDNVEPNDDILPGFEDTIQDIPEPIMPEIEEPKVEEKKEEPKKEETNLSFENDMIPGLETETEPEPTIEDSIIPGLEPEEPKVEDTLPGLETKPEPEPTIEDSIIPGLEPEEPKVEDTLPGLEDTVVNEPEAPAIEETKPTETEPMGDDVDVTSLLAGLDDDPVAPNDSTLPGFDDLPTDNPEPDDSILPGFEDFIPDNPEPTMPEFEGGLPGLDAEMPGLNDSKPSAPVEEKTEEPILPIDDGLLAPDVTIPGLDEGLPGLDDTTPKEEESLPGVDATIPGLDDNLPGLDDAIPGVEDGLPGLDERLDNIDNNDDLSIPGLDDTNSTETNAGEDNTAIESIKPKVDYSMSSLNSLLTGDKKIVAFLGSTKNGTSFLVNNLALMFSMMGIDTAILDMTQNRNSYYLFTDSREELRKIAYTSISKLENGYADGIKFNKSLTVYTALPQDGNVYENAEAVLSTLVQNHSLVFIDTDFTTPPGYFASAQEIYLVQSMDILTIQPLTAFLRDLKAKGAWEPEKARVVINKETSVKVLNNRMIIGGMSRYNGPDMSVMTDLFNKDMVKACSIPFDEKVYAKYLETMATCKLTLTGYPKTFMDKLKVLGEMVYPMLNSKKSYNPSASGVVSNTYNTAGGGFSNNTNNILSKMKKNY